VGLVHRPWILKDAIRLGGEESAGAFDSRPLAGKDGVLACLLVAEMMAARRRDAREQLGDLFRRVGREYWPLRANRTCRRTSRNAP